MAKSGGKVGKSDEEWLKVVNSGKKWGKREKVAKSWKVGEK